MSIVQEAKTKQVKLTLLISVENGILTVEGPIENKMVCAHMIADAFKFIMDQKVGPKIIPAISVVGGKSH